MILRAARSAWRYCAGRYAAHRPAERVEPGARTRPPRPAAARRTPATQPAGRSAAEPTRPSFRGDGWGRTRARFDSVHASHMLTIQARDEIGDAPIAPMRAVDGGRLDRDWIRSTLGPQ